MDGIMPLWKDRGMTSHDCVFKLRKILGIKKIGHAGTLDPNVDGVLLLAIGKGTKVIEFIENSDKTYSGEITLGFSTTTDDASGDLLDKVQLDETSISDELIDQRIEEMLGEQIQIPPMYSAVKVNGRKLYSYARFGQSVERPERKIRIKQFRRTSELRFNDSEQTISFDFIVECGKGTYIRTLAVDLGKKLGLPSHMSSLTRIGSSGITKEETVTLEAAAEMTGAGTIENAVTSIEKVLKNFDSFHLSENGWKMVKDGKVFEREEFSGYEFPLVFFYNNYAVAVYKIHPRKNHLIKPIKVLRQEM